MLQMPFTGHNAAIPLTLSEYVPLGAQTLYETGRLVRHG